MQNDVYVVRVYQVLFTNGSQMGVLSSTWLSRRAFVASGTAALLTSSAAVSAESGSIPFAGPKTGLDSTRVVWIGGAASIPGTREQLLPDDDGIWENTHTGERYTPFETPGAGAIGYIVVDVVHAAPPGFVLWQTILLQHNDAGRAASFIDTDGLVESSDHVSDFWIAPERLAEWQDSVGRSLRVVRMPYTLGSQTFRAIGIRSEVEGGVSQHFYDLDSGICLATGSTTEGGPVATLGKGDSLESGNGNTQLTFTRLAGIRQTALPGLEEQYPADFQKIRTIGYRGTKFVIIPGVSEYSVPIDLRYDVVSGRQHFLRARVSGTGFSTPVLRIIPPGVIGSVWMNPDRLNRYRKQQLLDEDEVTGVRAQVKQKDDETVSLALSTKVASQIFSYSRKTGLLIRAALYNRIGASEEGVELSLGFVE